ncbi:BnaC06g03350D [Brassica napus]|uniref:(rape) hypothetical protein n=1 Tax=Brassica napus TaxID=3708 RepID=A0A078I0F9_BRANA|nr:unnamed protein product [Brassica napus]CDY42523.1 BnaC06g03350D [Brassica napus]
MPHLLLRDRSAPLRLLRLYSSLSLLMSLHLHYHLYQLMFEQSKGEDEPEDRYGVEEQRGVWRKKGEAVRRITTAV